MKKLTLIFSGVLLLVSVVLFVNRVNLHAATGEPVPGAEVYIEQEPNDDPIANTGSDSNGNFEFNGLYGLEEGKYSVYIRLQVTKSLKKKLAKKKLLHIRFEIGKTRQKGKKVIVSKTILIKTSKVRKGKKIKVFSFKLKEDVLFQPNASKAVGSKSGFAIGGFSLT
ncbi:MAG: carboxypeptidase regulatory-like domain-containing protein [Candidatus Aminicenantes bacterium]|nr:carboxypeptidase regulatory-like domain-containing protein [Candidatus Aminicenantes bacterium]